MRKAEKNPAVAVRERRTTAADRRSQNSASLGDLDEIKQLIELIIEKGLSEFELERAGFRIRIARQVGGTAERAQAQPSPSATGAPARAAAAGIAAAAGEPAEPLQPEIPSVVELYTVRSPMVGTFYAGATEGAEPFVFVGDRVQPGQVLCIIEAMKLMNEIESDVAGEVVKCYAENGQPVEYGEPLFDIRPFAPMKRSS